MANSQLFASERSAPSVPGVVVENNAGGRAYETTAEHSLAQYAMTGTFSNTFYVDARAQLEDVLKLTEKVSPEFIAKLAIYARQKGYMKDMPAFLLAILGNKDVKLAELIFSQVIDNGKMLRNFVQMIRSGVTGRRSLGNALKRCVNTWLTKATLNQLLNASIGNDPSLGDVIKMTHPKPSEPWQDAFFTWQIGKPASLEALPQKCQDYDAFMKAVALKAEGNDVALPELPDVPFLMLSSLTLSAEQWKVLVPRMTWTQLRMNLNMLARNNVFDDKENVARIAAKLRDPETIAQARPMPYQMLATYVNVDKAVIPRAIIDALHDAFEISVNNAPTIDGRLVVALDVSGSMNSPITGTRKGQTTKVTNTMAGSLMMASLLRKNPDVLPLAFSTQVYDLRNHVEPRNAVLSTAQQLAGINGGGTACWMPFMACIEHNLEADLFIMISDNESWFGDPAGTNIHSMYQSSRTRTGQAWAEYKKKFPNAKLVCIDISPNTSVQVNDQRDVLNIGGFSDNVFDLISLFAEGKIGKEYWVGEIKKVTLV